LERSLLGSLSRLKEKNSDHACLFLCQVWRRRTVPVLACSLQDWRLRTATMHYCALWKCSTSKTVLTHHNTWAFCKRRCLSKSRLNMSGYPRIWQKDPTGYILFPWVFWSFVFCTYNCV
jgi:hypothetical protein